MKATFLAAGLLVLLPVACHAATDTDGCTFDQADQAKALAKLAAHHPGGKVTNFDRSITWRLPDGSTVVVGQGGCMDYGTTVRLQFAHGQHPAIEKALPQLVAVVRQYLSADYADDIADAWAKKAFDRSAPHKGIVEFDARRGDASRMPYPLVIELGATGISADWQEL